jgi:hypothetical protein
LPGLLDGERPLRQLVPAPLAFVGVGAANKKRIDDGWPQVHCKVSRIPPLASPAVAAISVDKVVPLQHWVVDIVAV